MNAQSQRYRTDCVVPIINHGQVRHFYFVNLLLLQQRQSTISRNWSIWVPSADLHVGKHDWSRDDWMPVQLRAQTILFLCLTPYIVEPPTTLLSTTSSLVNDVDVSFRFWDSLDHLLVNEPKGKWCLCSICGFVKMFPANEDRINVDCGTLTILLCNSAE